MNELVGFSFVKGKRDLKEIDRTDAQTTYFKDGTCELDPTLGGSSFTLGYGNREILNGLEDAMVNVARCQSNNGHYTESTKRAGEILTQGLWHSYAWALSGTSAVEAAISMNDEYWKALKEDRPMIISFSFAWHGTSFLTKDMGAPFLLKNHTGRCINIKHPKWDMEQDREQAEAEALHEVTNQLQGLNKNKIGCIIFDTATWINGVVPFSRWWWSSIRNLCDQYNILMITDDVASCWGKSCSYHPFQTFGYGIQPDISAVGKSLTAGYSPLGASLCNEKVGSIISQPGSWNYNHTWQPSMMGIHLMINTYNYIEKYDLMNNSFLIENELNVFGAHLLAKDLIYNYRVNGLFLALDMKARVNTNGLSSSQGSEKKIRICAPLNATESYFKLLRVYVDETNI